MKDLTSNIKR